MNTMHSDLHMAILHIWATIALIFIVIEAQLWAVPTFENKGEL